ncbi:MAG: hypothetical protein CME60_02595 [Halobacteriovoraceae bacterium]|nr:hypothetical protein [Halobacteriovoraceae bacterium]
MKVSVSSILKKFRNLKLQSEAGQVSIFLGMSLLVVVTFIAFIVNVGLFVKAKINLQNAVDAAAYAGAATQARQLTNIGHLNWEMRNTYKEWMLKYYVFGNIGLDSIENPDGTDSGNPSCNGNVPLNPSNTMNFRLRQFRGANCQHHDPEIYDRFNVPSICIHYGSSNNICEIVSLPGLPRFNTVGLPSISEQHESFLNNIVATKSNDCSERSAVNQGAAIMWTYGIGKADILPGVPQIASTRIGAWVEAIELGMRMRNLEAIVNAPPITDFVCNDPSATTSGCVPIANYTENNNSLPYYERINKAFFSAYRNLSGGNAKEGGNSLDMGSRFRLREIPPTPLLPEVTDLSAFLIPADSPALQKYYLDLKAMPVNYAIFYTAFFSTTAKFKNTSVTSEGQCGGLKVALPVPGYLMGFYKNPQVVTYYAVEGESEFVGLFYPFLNTEADRNGITLKAYSAAKPFGGRVGPILFRSNNTQTEIRQNGISRNYISAFDVDSSITLDSSTPVEDKKKVLQGGYPIPLIVDFWVTGTTGAVVGGNPIVAGNPKYGIPNLTYDFQNFAQVSDDTGTLGVIAPSPSDNTAYFSGDPTLNSVGLYNIDQFKLFVQNREGSVNSAFSDEDILRSIHNVRAPTRYEALNYLVPVMDQSGNNPLGIDANSYIHPAQAVGVGFQNPNAPLYNLYAPLITSDGLYNSPEAASQIVREYIQINESSIDLYTDALKEVAEAVREVGATTAGGDSYDKSADTIYKDPIEGFPDTDCDTLSMAQKFKAFFNTTQSACSDITPIADHVNKYFNEQNGNPQWRYFYTRTYKDPSDKFDPKLLLTAYQPGSRQGADADGNIGSPFTPSTTTLAKRNSYSTKFIPIKSVLPGGGLAGSSGIPIFAEGTNSESYTAEAPEINEPMQNFVNTVELVDYGTDPKF